MCRLLCICVAFLCSSPFFANQPSQDHNGEEQRRAVLAKIPPTSLRQLLIFSSIYSGTQEGQTALRQAWKILSGVTLEAPPPIPHNFADIALQLPRLIESSSGDKNTPTIPPETLHFISQAGAFLPNRSLKGYHASSLQDLETLSSSEVDLARALVLLENESHSAPSSVEPALDLLALEILASLGPNPSEEEKIAAINQVIFHDLDIRYPPLSQANRDSQTFSELSSVFSSRRGICLGTTVLYLCLAQRLGLSLTVYTPPGHIFVGHKRQTGVRVIETTARGIDVPLSEYLGLSLRHVPERSIKEVIGMVFFNRGGGYLKKKQYDEARICYQQAALFENDPELSQISSLCELLAGHQQRSRELAKIPTPSYRREQDLLLLDLREGTLSPTAGQAFLSCADAEGEALPDAISTLQKCLVLCPKSRVLPYQLAHCWLLLGKAKEALPIVEALSRQDGIPPSVHCILASLYLERQDFPKAWEESLLAFAQCKSDVPLPLKLLVEELQRISPRTLPKNVLQELSKAP